MLLVRIEYVSPTPPPQVMGKMAAIPSTGDRVVFSEDDAALYVQSVSYVIDPKPGYPVAIIRLSE